MLRLLSIITSLFALSALLFLGVAGFLFLNRSPDWNSVFTENSLTTLPCYSEFTEKIPLDTSCESPLSLKWEPPKIQLPDLQKVLLYYGTLKRPDCKESHTHIHVSLVGEEEIRLFSASTPIYLSFSNPLSQPQVSSQQSKVYGSDQQTDLATGRWTFSPSNQPTSLWLEVEGNASANRCHFRVHMVDETGQEIQSPEKNTFVTLFSKEIPKNHLIGWQLGEHRVDSTLLIRQKARWIGSDRFLELHGGEPYTPIIGAQRIEFPWAENSYCIFVKQGDQFIWEDQKEKWMPAPLFEKTLDCPLLVVKRIEENVIYFDLWDAQSKGCIQLNLVRSKELTPLPKIEEEFRFLGAKTWSKFIVESHGDRLILKANDWLVLDPEEGWLPLSSCEMIDAYVEGSLQGPLLVLEKLVKTKRGQTLLGHLFSTSRTHVEPVVLHATAHTQNKENPFSYYPPTTMEDKS